MRVVQYAGRLAELVAYTIDAIQHAPSSRGGSLHLRRDVQLAQAALNRLQMDYRRPPLFAELAQDVGTNQNKLKAVFKDAFGLTMAEYCLERRMREAQLLLMEATLTIAQVADRVGYEHQSSFAAAFRGHVGMSAREYRQHRAPFSQTLE
jgi:AraC-like DNA-binding protein